MFFLSVNRRVFHRSDNYEVLVEEILALLAHLRDPHTGTWFRGNPSLRLKLNGAMKVLTGLHWLDRPNLQGNSLLDFALSQPFEEDGCGFLNRLYVVHEAAKMSPSGYRAGEIRDLAWKALRAALRFQRSDGGFSFYESHSQTSYYGALVSKGLPVSDLHGCAMITWAIGLCVDMLADAAPRGSEHWRAHEA